MYYIKIMYTSRGYVITNLKNGSEVCILQEVKFEGLSDTKTWYNRIS